MIVGRVAGADAAVLAGTVAGSLVETIAARVATAMTGPGFFAGYVTTPDL